MRPIVGLLPLWDAVKESMWMLPGYMNGIQTAGAIPVMFPITEDKEALSQLVSMVDGILFTGGQDVSPDIYGEEPLEGKVFSCRMRDDMEQIVLKLALEQNKSILGICRGLQFINAAMGGSLYQDLPSQHLSETEHHQDPPYDVPVHEVVIAQDSPLCSLLGREHLSVNSYHHQAIKTLAPGLSAMAVSEDGLVEAIYKPEARFLWAVQWHPEFMFRTDADEMKIFEAFAVSMMH